MDIGCLTSDGDWLSPKPVPGVRTGSQELSSMIESESALCISMGEPLVDTDEASGIIVPRIQGVC